MPERRARFHFDNTFGDERRPVGAFILWQVGDLCCEPGYTVAAHRQAVHELTLAVSGMGENLAGGTAYPMTPGTLIFNPRGDLHEITAARAQTLRYFYLGFDFPDTPSPSPRSGRCGRFSRPAAPARQPTRARSATRSCGCSARSTRRTRRASCCARARCRRYYALPAVCSEKAARIRTGPPTPARSTRSSSAT